MFALTMGTGMNLGFPDVCKTPVGPVVVPIPYPNINISATSAPAAYNILIDGMPVINQLSEGMVSMGDNAGVLGGIVSNIIDGQTQYILGCFTIFMGGAPAQRLTSITAQNCMVKLPNCPGMCIVPSQVTVLTLG